MQKLWKDKVESQEQTLCIMSAVQVLSLGKLNSDWTGNRLQRMEWVNFSFFETKFYLEN